ncbi:hypothetical protein CSC94_12630 [Zhengella mangrovi]|uniref:Uncharacterized protein n=2 Tax=Zhengella mangrovi TaxID=1982044 RepID=A0A2G1QML0_9HYPH|nr:hypothetical protein CSC94_12630 [Zhengella mangrovi]
MSVAVIKQAKCMAEFILQREHRGPGDTIDAAMHRVERAHGIPATWLHRLRYREIKDMPASTYVALTKAYEAACARAERAYELERAKHETDTAVVRMADLVAGKK